MELTKGQRHSRPADAEASWYAEVLANTRRLGVGDLSITVYTSGGDIVSGGLEGADYELQEVHISQPSSPDELVRIPCEEILAFVLLPEGPINRSDELRGS